MEFRFETQPWLSCDYRESQIQDEIGKIIKKCLARVRSWRVPYNWSFQDWFDEIEELATAAAWLAASDYKQSATSVVPWFVQQRVLSTVRTRYRQEFLYGLRFGSRLVEYIGDSEEQSDWALSYVEPSIEPTTYGDLAAALEKLSPDQRFLIEQLFWQERTETQLATSLSLSQRGVSKRKQSALRALRILLSEPENPPHSINTSPFTRKAFR